MKLLLKRLLSLVPTKLPVGMAQFEIFAAEIVALTGPIASEDSLRFAIATQIMHLGPQRSSVPKNFFVRSLRKAAANQVAGQIFQDIKLKQQQAVEEAQKQQAEATAAKEQAAASDVQTQ